MSPSDRCPALPDAGSEPPSLDGPRPSGQATCPRGSTAAADRRLLQSKLAPCVLLLASVLSSCVSFEVSEQALDSLVAGDLDPCRVVFLCEGMLHDLGAEWDVKLAEELREAGLLAIRVRYWSDPTGVWFNWGCRAPGRRVAELAEAVARLHEEHAPGRPLVIDAVGFSSGAEVLLEAFGHLERAQFRRVVLIQSSSFALSFEVDRWVEQGKVSEVVHYWSPIDLTTLLAPLGAGNLGLHHRSDAVRNEMRFALHTARFIGEGTRRRIREDLGAASPPPVVGRGSYAEALRAVLSAAADGSCQ